MVTKQRIQPDRVASVGRPARVTFVFALLALGAVPAPDRPPTQGAAPPDRNKRLGERLIRKTVTDTDEDPMDRLARMMEEAARKLEIEFDAGETTQALQQRILDRFDEVIRVAAAQRRPVRARPRVARGDQRRMPKGRPPPQGPRAPSARRKPPSADAAAPPAAPVPGHTKAGRLGETRRTWGNLPMRQREEIIQGIGEHFLENYRIWIEQYYQALQEPEAP